MAHAGILSKGIKLSTSSTLSGTYTELPNLQSTPDLALTGGENVDVTTLADSRRVYINGIIDDSDGLEFGFLYDSGATGSAFDALTTMSGPAYFKMELPDNKAFTFEATPEVTVNGAGVNDAVTFTANLKISSDITLS